MVKSGVSFGLLRTDLHPPRHPCPFPYSREGWVLFRPKDTRLFPGPLSFQQVVSTSLYVTSSPDRVGKRRSGRLSTRGRELWKGKLEFFTSQGGRLVPVSPRVSVRRRTGTCTTTRPTAGTTSCTSPSVGTPSVSRSGRVGVGPRSTPGRSRLRTLRPSHRRSQDPTNRGHV